MQALRVRLWEVVCTARSSSEPPESPFGGEDPFAAAFAADVRTPDCARAFFFFFPFPQRVYLLKHLGKEKGAAFAKLDNWPSSSQSDWLRGAL